MSIVTEMQLLNVRKLALVVIECYISSLFFSDLNVECSQCHSKFATEGLLREHIRSHVNQFKCPQCEMTCPSKSTLQNHIKYRHTNNKPFKCPNCEKR